MEILSFSSKEQKLELNRFRNDIIQFLKDLTCKYPFFYKWLNQALDEAPSKKRSFLICLNGSELVGLAILKNTDSEKKICTLRVDNNYWNRGIGFSLLKKAFEVLGTEYPLMTINEEHKTQYERLFRKVHAKKQGRVMSLYNWGVYEYFYNIPYQHKNALLSIKPKYIEMMANGIKCVEFRKKIFKDTIERIYIYASSPIQRIVGYIDHPEIIQDTPVNLWNKYYNVAGIDIVAFNKYYDNCNTGYAISFNEIFLYKESIDPKKLIEKFTAPQSYCYIDNIGVLKFLNSEKVK